MRSGRVVKNKASLKTHIPKRVAKSRWLRIKRKTILKKILTIRSRKSWSLLKKACKKNEMIMVLSDFSLTSKTEKTIR